MRKALKRAAHVLVAAGALGLVRPAVAQTSAPTAKTPYYKSNASVIIRTSATETASSGEDKLAETEVELALLANPGTFAYALSAKHTGANLELRGFVPNKMIKEQAVEIATKHCSVAIVDMLQIHPTLTLRSPAGTADELHQGATALLAENFSEAADLEIKVTGPGHVAIHGSCDSQEQKLAISKKLRGLNGCCCVDNQLSVKTAMGDSHSTPLATTNGLRNLEGSSSPYMPSPKNRVDSLPPLVTEKTPALAVTPSKVVVPPPALAPMKTEVTPPLATVRAEVTLPTSPSQNDRFPPSKSDTVPPAKLLTNELPPLTPAKPLASATYTTPVAAPLAASTSPFANVPAYAKEPVSNVGWQPKAPEQVVHLPGPITPVQAVTPAGGWAPAHETKTQEKKVPPTPYAASGVVIFDEPLPEPPAVLAKDKTSLLKQQVASVCGGKARDVVIETKPDGSMQVHVKTFNQNDNENLITKILLIPEMASPNVKLCFEVGN